EGNMRSGKGLLRAVSAFAFSLALVAPFTASVAAEGGPLNSGSMPASLRARVSGLADLALSSESGNPAAANQPANFFPGGDECAVERGPSGRSTQTSPTVADPALQARARAKNERGVAPDPNIPRHVIASYNDYRRGDGTCGTSYSLNGGETWNDSTAPNGFT